MSATINRHLDSTVRGDIVESALTGYTLDDILAYHADLGLTAAEVWRVLEGHDAHGHLADTEAGATRTTVEEFDCEPGHTHPAFAGIAVPLPWLRDWQDCIPCQADYDAAMDYDPDID